MSNGQYSKKLVQQKCADILRGVLSKLVLRDHLTTVGSSINSTTLTIRSTVQHSSA
jgi:hypothetical protein